MLYVRELEREANSFENLITEKIWFFHELCIYKYIYGTCKVKSRRFGTALPIIYLNTCLFLMKYGDKLKRSRKKQLIMLTKQKSKFCFLASSFKVLSIALTKEKRKE